MTAPVDLSVIRDERKERCMFCGQAEHFITLACPRVIGVELDFDGSISAVRLQPIPAVVDEPDDAA